MLAASNTRASAGRSRNSATVSFRRRRDSRTCSMTAKFREVRTRMEARLRLDFAPNIGFRASDRLLQKASPTIRPRGCILPRGTTKGTILSRVRACALDSRRAQNRRNSGSPVDAPRRRALRRRNVGARRGRSSRPARSSSSTSTSTRCCGVDVPNAQQLERPLTVAFGGRVFHDGLHQRRVQNPEEGAVGALVP